MKLYPRKLAALTRALIFRGSVTGFLLALLLIFHQQLFAGNYKISTTTINLTIDQPSFAAPGPVTGTVRDETGQPLPGVSVKVKGTSTGTQTNASGQFTLNVNKGTTLVFSFIGYEPKELTANGTGKLDVTLNQKLSTLNEVVVNGYTSQKRADVTAAISTVSGKDILKSPVTNVTNSLAGLVPGLIVQQPSGRPGISTANLYIRGRVSPTATALIIVDGVERTTFGDIDPNEIESINVLKDASSTALYGLKGANGVFVITTKKGKEGPAKVSFTNNIGIVSPTSRPRVLSSFESASLHTEGQINVGEARTFTDADLQNFKDGTGNPLLYPNVDWYSALIKKYWTQNQQNLNISGGTKSIRYFTSFGHQFEDGNFKTFKTPLDYATTPSYQRYNFRARVGIDITKTTNFEVNLAGRNEHRYTPAGMSEYNDPAGVVSNGIEGLVGRTLKIPAFATPFFPEYTNSDDPKTIALDATYNHIVDNNYGVNSFNPYALLTYGGYAFTDNNVAESVFTLNQKLDVITKGLSFKAQFGYDATLLSGKLQRGSTGYFNLDRTTLALSPNSGTYNDFFGTPAYTRSGYTKTNLQLFLNYARSFGKNNVSANVIGQRELQGSAAAAAPYANQGIVSQVTYNYGERYFLTGSATYNGSENYAPGYRYGFFPSASVGYNMANEKWLKDATWVSLLKIRASVGKVGIPSPGTGRFYYQNKFGISTSTVPFGNPNSVFNAPIYTQTQYGNPYVTFEESLKKNIGLDASFFHDKLSITAELFNDRRSNILIARANTSFATYGATVPSTNYGVNTNHGYEFTITYQNRIKDFNYSISGNMSYARNIRQVLDEAPGLAANLKATGTPIGTFFGYHVLGFYADQRDIDNSPVNKVTTVKSIPGDLKYQDVNGDGVINSQDVMPIGHPNIPEYNGGLTLQAGYKGFQLSVLFNGVTNVSSNVIFGSNGLDQYFEPQLGRWTPTHTNATWPVIRPGLDPNPNESLNDFILQNASYIKLRNVQLTYTLPRSILNRLHVSNLTFILSGQNLKTWTKFYGIDPENALSGNAYASSITAIPTTKVFNFGINISL